MKSSLYLVIALACGILSAGVVGVAHAHSIPGKNLAHQVKNKVYKKKEAHAKQGKGGLLHHH
jgi:hypothetical protein